MKDIIEYTIYFEDNENKDDEVFNSLKELKEYIKNNKLKAKNITQIFSKEWISRGNSINNYIEGDVVLYFDKQQEINELNLK